MKNVLKVLIVTAFILVVWFSMIAQFDRMEPTPPNFRYQRCVAVMCTDCYGSCLNVPDPLIVRGPDVSWHCYDKGDDDIVDDCDGWQPTGKTWRVMRKNLGIDADEDFRECHCVEWEDME